MASSLECLASMPRAIDFVHDAEDAAAGVPEEEAAVAVHEVDDALVLGKDVGADSGRRGQQGRAEAQVVSEAADEEGVAVALEELGPERGHEIADALVEGGVQLGIVGLDEGEVFEADEVLADLEDAVADAAERHGARGQGGDEGIEQGGGAAPVEFREVRPTGSGQSPRGFEWGPCRRGWRRVREGLR